MRILFITSTRIGDAVLSTGLLNHLVCINSGARITVACGPLAAPLFTAVPGLEQILTLTKGRFCASHWVRLWIDCVQIQWDIIVDLRRSVLPWLLISGRRYRLGRSCVLTHRVCQIAKVLDLSEPPAPHLWTTVRHQKTADYLLPPDGRLVLGVGATANWYAKTWRVERFITLIDRLTSTGGILPNAKVAVFGAWNERTRVQPILDYLTAERCIDLVGKVDLLTAYACLQRCAFYVGNDSGVMHLAAAADLPTLGLFGPSKELHYAPWSRRGAIVRATVAPVSLTEAYRLNSGYCKAAITSHSMDSLTVEAVEAAAWNLWVNTRDEGFCS